MTNEDPGVPLPFDHPALGESLHAVLDTLVKESDKGAVLVGAALVDNFLRTLFEKVAPAGMGKKALAALLDYPGALSSVSAKADVAFATRLIGKRLHQSIHALRKIRNDVAHSPQSFRLSDHRARLSRMYDLGPGIDGWVNNAANHLVLDQFVTALRESGGLNGFETTQELFDYVFREHPDLGQTLQEKVYRYELAVAISMICTTIVLAWERTRSRLPGDNLISAPLPPADIAEKSEDGSPPANSAYEDRKGQKQRQTGSDSVVAD